MADKEIVSSPEFIQELLPSGKRTALLYHLSYLCLGGFPQLECLLRKRALETQLLFGSSEAVLLKCVGTSENLVKYLLPSLKVAAEKNKPELAKKFLEKASAWISEIINDVKNIVERYNKHNSDVAESTSHINNAKDETEKKQQKQTNEMKALQNIAEGLEERLKKMKEEIDDSEKKIVEKNAEIQKFISSINSSNEKPPAGGIGMAQAMAPMMPPPVAIFTMIMPFLDSIMNFISKIKLSKSQASMIKTLQTGLSELTSAQQQLKENEWKTQNQLMDNQLNLAKLRIENGQLPSITHLDEVQKCLSRIQQILVQLQKFWEKVGSMLDTLKARTFAGDTWIDDLADMKEQFVESIDAAKEGWNKFGKGCIEANKIFSNESNKAYTFLEINPSSLSKEDWQIQYESVKNQLEAIKPNTVIQNAITQ